MNDEKRGLVDDQEVVVLVHDVQGNRLRRRLRYFGRRQFDNHSLSFMEDERGSGAFSLYADAAILDPPLGLSAAGIGDMGGYCPIQALVLVLTADRPAYEPGARFGVGGAEFGDQSLVKMTENA